jgi:hypothetical protein
MSATRNVPGHTRGISYRGHDAADQSYQLREGIMTQKLADTPHTVGSGPTVFVPARKTPENTAPQPGAECLLGVIFALTRCDK